MDEEDGTTLRDLTGAYNGTYYNNPTSNPGFVLRSRQFDGLPGNSQWGEALTAPNFIAGTDLTIDAWIKPLTTSSGLRPIVDKRAYINGPSYTGPIGYAMNVTGGYLTFQLDAQGSSASYVMTSPALNDGKWHFVAAVVHRTSPYLVTLWVDGTSQTFAAPQVTGDLTNSARLFIAREYSHPGGSPHFFSGSIDEVEIFNRALDPTELDDIYRAGSSGKCKCYLPPAHMTAWYMLDELAGVGIAHDSVSPASDATYSTSGPAVIPGMVDNALAFDGSANDYATAPAPAAGFTGDINLDPDTDTIQSFTIDAWVRIYSPNPSTTWWMLDKRDAATHGYSFYINSSKKLVLRMGSFTATSTTTIPLNTTTNTTWAFVAVAVNRNTGKGRLYINGVPGPLFTPPSYSVYNPNALLFANHYVAGAGGQFIPSTQPSHLDLDEVEFFDRALTSTQIMALYNAQGAGKCKPYVRSMPVPTPTPIAPPVGMLDGHLTWQGVTQPNDQNTDRAAILNVCAAGLTNSYIVTTDESGNFSMDLELPDGSYDWQVQGDRSLANAGTIAGGNPLVMSGGAATLEVGTQKAGDASNDNIVNTLDFNILKPTFGRGSGDAGYDERSDFNNDNLANTSDFNLLKGNFGVDGRALTCP
jgi:hypothetical protein